MGLQRLPRAARCYVRVVIGVGATALLAVALTRPLPWSLPLLAATLLAAGLASQKLVLVGLPGEAPTRTHLMSTLSLGFPVVFGSLLWFGPEGGLLVGVASGLGAGFYPRRHPCYRIAFTSLSLGLTALVSGCLMRDLGVVEGDPETAGLFALLMGTLAYYLLNTVLVSVAVSLSQGACPWTTWRKGYLWTAPSYLAGAIVVTGAYHLQRQAGVVVASLTLLCLYLVHLSCKSYLEKVNQLQHSEKRLEEVCLAAVESLALAIDAKDSGTHCRIRRVQKVALALGEQLGMTPSELQAVRVASLTHDIGKLAVPDTILAKAGPLSPAEFERVKTHVEVGARILEPVQFPWPVLDVVRSHHERWDGLGYPRGLKGEEIPLGGRVVALADVFDALTSARPYREALSYHEAQAFLRGAAGTRFDPRVVEAFTAIFPVLVADLEAMDAATRRVLEQQCGPEPVWGPGSRPADPRRAKREWWDEIRGASQESLSLAFTDPLTGLSNGRYLEAVLERQIEDARRSGRALALLMIDLDGFKEINDGYGHLAGDAALQMVAKVIRSAVRDGATVCRYAGDEFVVLLPDTRAEHAERVADRLHAAVSDCVIPGTSRRVGLSAGIAAFPQDGTDPRMLLSAAEARMYTQKSQRKATAAGPAVADRSCASVPVQR